MLVLGRKVGERIRIGDDVHLVVVEIRGGRVRLGIEAPEEVLIRRNEMLANEATDGESREATVVQPIGTDSYQVGGAQLHGSRQVLSGRANG